MAQTVHNTPLPPQQKINPATIDTYHHHTLPSHSQLVIIHRPIDHQANTNNYSTAKKSRKQTYPGQVKQNPKGPVPF
jgi:hypothetical protein